MRNRDVYEITEAVELLRENVIKNALKKAAAVGGSVLLATNLAHSQPTDEDLKAYGRSMAKVTQDSAMQNYAVKDDAVSAYDEEAENRKDEFGTYAHKMTSGYHDIKTSRNALENNLREYTELPDLSKRLHTYVYNKYPEIKKRHSTQESKEWSTESKIEGDKGVSDYLTKNANSMHEMYLAGTIMDHISMRPDEKDYHKALWEAGSRIKQEDQDKVRVQMAGKPNSI